MIIRVGVQNKNILKWIVYKQGTILSQMKPVQTKNMSEPTLY